MERNVNEIWKKKILLIEDDKALREAIVDALKLEGFVVLSAANGKQGIEITKKEIPDLILCDIMLPEMDGYQVYEQLKAEESSSLIPFIFLTALAERENVRKGMNLGADDYITKPILLNELSEAIYVRLGKSDQLNLKGEKRLNELRERMIYSIPHELLTPLQGILGFSELISDNAEAYSLYDIKSMAAGIKSAGQRLDSLINNYLKYARYSLKKDLRLDLVNTISISDTITTCAEKVASKYDREGDLYLQISDANIKMRLLDFDYLITELIDNAFKFSTPGEKVTIECGMSKNWVKIKIADKGLGFPMDKVSDIGAFNQFNRKKMEQQGSGLGLITCKLIVHQYRGELLVDKNNPGTKVTIRFPSAVN